MGGAVFSKSLIQFSVDGWAYVPSLLFTWGQTMVEVMKITGSSFKRSHPCTATLSAPTLLQDTADPCLCRRLLDTHRQVSCGVTVPFSWVLVHKVLLCPPRVSVLYKFWKLYSGVNGDLLQGDLILTHEEPKPPHCVKKRLHFRVLRKESLDIP